MSAEITMTDAITALVAEKRAVGYKYAAEDRVLTRFAAFYRSEFPGLGTPDRLGRGMARGRAAARSHTGDPARQRVVELGHVSAVRSPVLRVLGCHRCRRSSSPARRSSRTG